MDVGLNGRVALVTGGASGIGHACARELTTLGASVLIADLDADRAAHVASELGDSASAVHTDVTDPGSVAAMMSYCVATFGRLDIAINSAGVGMPIKAAVGSTDTREWERVLAINLHGTFLCMQAEIAAIKSDGAIVNIASVMSEVAAAGSSAYVASKHGLLGLTKVAALDHAAAGIRVNAVGPGFIDTPLLSGRDPEYLAAVGAMHPLGRLGRADEVAAAAVFLTTPAASFITGAYVPVDGGYLAR